MSDFDRNELLERIATALERQVAQQDEEIARREKRRSEDVAVHDSDREEAIRQNDALIAKIDEINKGREQISRAFQDFDRRLKAVEAAAMVETVQ